MKFNDFKNAGEMLLHFGLKVKNNRFIDFDKIKDMPISEAIKEDIEFVLAERGDTDLEFYACEFLISPLLKEAWKRNPQAKLFSHPRIVYQDLVLIPDYVVAPKHR